MLIASIKEVPIKTLQKMEWLFAYYLIYQLFERGQSWTTIKTKFKAVQSLIVQIWSADLLYVW